MPEMIDHITHLSQEIGPRPAGTEEEQAAAAYIAEAFQSESGLESDIEDFGGVPTHELPAVICSGAAILFTLLSFFLPVLRVPALLVTLAAAGIFIAEALGVPVLSRFLGNGVSQNVVARYLPSVNPETGSTRRRKIIFVTRYDSGKVRTELSSNFARTHKTLNYAVLGGMITLPVFALIRTVFMANVEGAPIIVLNILSVVVMLLAAVPVVVYILHQTAQYNDAANGSASGVAMLIELAARIRYGNYTQATQTDAHMHGEDVLLESGLIPEGATLSYESPVEDPDFVPQTDAERLAAAKAAIAGLTGKPVAGMNVSYVSDNLVNVKEPPIVTTEGDQQVIRDETREALNSIPEGTVDAALKNAEEDAALRQLEAEKQDALAAAAAGVISAAPVTADIPEWFIKAQQKANRTGVDNKPVQRSRYAAALDAADEQSTGYFDQVSAAMEQQYGYVPAEPLPEALEQTQAEMTEDPKTADISQGDASFAENAIPQEDAEQVTGDIAEDITDADVVPEDVQNSQEDELDNAQESAVDSAPSLYDVIEREPRLEPDNLEKFAGLPSFLNPLKVQQEAQLAQDDQPRTADRVSVTVDPSASTGRIFMTRPTAHADAASVRRPIQLPDVREDVNHTPVVEMAKQRAPLADGSLDIPAIQTADDAMPDNRRMALRSMLPSISGALPVLNDQGVETEAPMPLSEPVSLTGSFAPISEELLSNVNPDDIYVDDADDSAYGEEFTQTGAFAGAGYVDMPTSRASRFFGKFRKKKAQQDVSAQEWLNVDADFDARTVGKQRGSWESFRQEEIQEDVSPFAVQTEAPQLATYDYEEEPQFATQAFDGDYIEDLGATTAFQPIPSEEAFDDYFAAAPEPAKKKRRFPWQGGAFGGDIMDALDRVADTSDVTEDVVYEEAKDAVYAFHNEGINTEVWFVALGAELEGNAGMKAFLDTHHDELRGALIVDIDSVGAGDLTLIDPEGVYKKVRPASRMKRYLKKASQASGVRYNTEGIHYQDSAASVAIKNGCQAIHLAGMGSSGKPAFYAEAADTVENINVELLEENASFLMEFVKAI